MDDKLLRHTGELALIWAIPLLSDMEEKSRLCGLQKTLQKWAAKDLQKLKRRMTKEELDAVIELVLAWGAESGWLNTSKQTGTLISFCANIIENSEFDFHPRILECINDLVAHLENGNNYKYQSSWAGSLAAEKWEKLFEDDEVKSG